MRHHNLQVTGSVVVNGLGLATTADLNTYTASADAKISTLQAFTSSVGTTNTFTASASSRLNSIETISASNLSRIGSLETISASNIARISSLETTSASVDTLNIAQNTRLTNLEIKTGSLATTGSNTFFGTQTFSGSLYITTDLIVQGSSSLQNITASAVSIGTNIINLNTANPAIRYAGLVIGDSGSIGSSGSFLYDSVQDEMIFVHRGANSTVTSSVVLMGPQTYDSIGSESYLTNNRITKGTGNEHLVDSNISDNGTLVTINSVTSSFSGIVGIGITTPMNVLHLTGALPTPSLRLGSISLGFHWDIGRENQTTGDFVFNNANGGATSERLRITTTGNLGLGVTPSAWNSTQRVLEIGGPENGYIAFNATNLQSYIYWNAYYDSDNIYKKSSQNAAAFGVNASGNYVWFNAPSGTAGNAITFTQTMTLNSSGNLSIGNTNNTYKLDVSGTSILRGTSIVTSAGGYSTGLVIQNTNTSANNYSVLTLQANTDGYPIVEFKEGATQKWQIFNDWDNDSLNFYKWIGTAGTVLSLASTGTATFSNRVVVSNSAAGAATISTSNSNATDDAGMSNLNFDGNRLRLGVLPSNSAYGCIGTNGGSTGLAFVTHNGSSFGERMRIKPDGGVRIGSTTAFNEDIKLNVYGTGVWNGANIGLQNGGTGGKDWIIFSTMDSFGQGGGNLLFYNNSGPASNNLILYANGNYDFAGSDISDIRLKQDIENINFGLNEIMQLSPKSYHLKSEDNLQGENQTTLRKRYGFIAQEVQSILPDTITGEETETDYLGLDYNGVLAVAVKAIQDLKAENDSLKEILQRNGIN